MTARPAENSTSPRSTASIAAPTSSSSRTCGRDRINGTASPRAEESGRGLYRPCRGEQRRLEVVGDQRHLLAERRRLARALQASAQRHDPVEEPPRGQQPVDVLRERVAGGFQDLAEVVVVDPVLGRLAGRLVEGGARFRLEAVERLDRPVRLAALDVGEPGLTAPGGEDAADREQLDEAAIGGVVAPDRLDGVLPLQAEAVHLTVEALDAVRQRAAGPALGAGYLGPGGGAAEGELDDPDVPVAPQLLGHRLEALAVALTHPSPSVACARPSEPVSRAADRAPPRA